MIDESVTAPVVYDLDKKYIDYIAFMMQKIKKLIIEDIKELSKTYDLPDNMIEDILMSQADTKEDLDA